jgi:sister-chromatid-cohesion protein PDS5
VSDAGFRRAKTARWNSDQSESEEEPSSDDSEQDDREDTPTKPSSEREDGSSGQESDEEANGKKGEQHRKPSRRAGTRAKVGRTSCYCALSSLTLLTEENQSAGEEEG